LAGHRPQQSEPIGSQSIACHGQRAKPGVTFTDQGDKIWQG